MFKKCLWIVALGFSLVLSQSIFANPCKEGLKKMVESLDLDSAQKDKIKPIIEQLKASKKDNWTQMKDLDTQMHQLATAATLDQTAINALVDKKTALIGNMMKAKITATNQIYGVLTAKQKTELQSKMDKWEGKMAEKFKDCHSDD